MRAALVYDRVNKWGGAERVLLAFQQMFPQAPLYTSVYHPVKASWAKVFPQVIPSFLQHLPWARDHHEKLALLMPIAFENFSFAEYDLVISVTSEAAKGILVPPGTKHICYCLTPTRYLWSHYRDYFPDLLRQGFSWPLIQYLRKWDLVAAQRPDKMIAISEAVSKRIKKYYHRSAEVIHPPLNSQLKSAKIKKGNYFLVVSRLVPYKRVDLVVQAFNQLGLPLVIVGSGSQANQLQAQAKSNIRFAGFVSEQKLADYYAGCRALIFPQREDFGLTAIEAMSFGKPVIAFGAGGARDMVVESRTGLFFQEQNQENLTRTVEQFATIDFNPKKIKKHAQKFSQKRFEREFKKLVKEIL